MKKESYPAGHANQLSLEKHVQKLLVCTLIPVQALAHFAFDELVRSIDPKLKVINCVLFSFILGRNVSFTQAILPFTARCLVVAGTRGVYPQTASVGSR